MFYKKYLQYSFILVLLFSALGCGETPIAGNCVEGKWGNGDTDRYRFFVVRNNPPLKFDVALKANATTPALPQIPNLPSIDDVASGKVRVGALANGTMARVNSPVRTAWIWTALIALVCIGLIAGAIFCIAISFGVCAAPVLTALTTAGGIWATVSTFLAGGAGVAIVLGAGSVALSTGVSNISSTIKDLTYDFQVHLDSGPQGDNKGTPFENFRPYSEDPNGVLYTTCQAACYQFSDLAIQKIGQFEGEMNALLQSSNVKLASVPKDEASIESASEFTAVQKFSLKRLLVLKERVEKLKQAVTDSQIKESIKSCEQQPVYYSKGDSAENVATQMNALKSAEGCHRCGNIDTTLFEDIPGAGAMDNIFSGNLNQSNRGSFSPQTNAINNALKQNPSGQAENTPLTNPLTPAQTPGISPSEVSLSAKDSEPLKANENLPGTRANEGPNAPFSWNPFKNKPSKGNTTQGGSPSAGTSGSAGGGSLGGGNAASAVAGNEKLGADSDAVATNSGGTYSQGGAQGGSGNKGSMGDFNFGFGSPEKKSSAQDIQFQNAQGNLEVMLSEDPENYFGLTNVNDSIFKVVEKRYRQKTRDWILNDSKK